MFIERVFDEAQSFPNAINSVSAHTALPIEKSPHSNKPGSPVDTGDGSDLASDTVGPIFMRWREETSREEPWDVYHVGLGIEIITQCNQKREKACNNNILA